MTGSVVVVMGFDERGELDSSGVFRDSERAARWADGLRRLGLRVAEKISKPQEVRGIVPRCGVSPRGEEAPDRTR